MSTRENYRTSSNYTSNSYNAGITKSPKTNNTVNGNNNRDTYRTTTQYTQYTPKQIKDAKAKVAADKIADDLKRLNELQYEKPTGLARISPLKMGLYYTGVGKKTFEINKSYFQKNVADQFINGKKSSYTNSPESFKQYMKDRGMGKVDAYGRTINNRDEGGGSNYVVEKNVGGKSILTTEKKVAEDAETKTEYDARQTKKKGRSKNILTSKRGVMKTAADYSLGKKSLLGQVV